MSDGRSALQCWLFEVRIDCNRLKIGLVAELQSNGPMRSMMQAIQCLFCSRQLTLSLQPAFIAQRELFDLLGKIELQLFTAFHQGGAELEEVLLDQAGRCSEGHAASRVRTVGSLAQGLVSRLRPSADQRC